MALVPAVHSGDSRVFIWSRTNLSAPVCVLTGHEEAVLDLKWRRYGGGKCYKLKESFYYLQYKSVTIQ